MYYSKGGVNKDNLDKMPLGELDLHIKESKRIQDMQNKDQENED